jgi:PQQ-like domain
MSAERFIEILAQRQLVSDQLFKKLRDKVAEKGGPQSAAAMAVYLVQRKYLSQQQAIELLRNMPGVDARTIESELIRGLAAEADADSTSPSGAGAPTADAKDADFEDDSSIFAPLFHSKKGDSVEPSGKTASGARGETKLPPREGQGPAKKPPVNPNLFGRSPAPESKGLIPKEPASKGNEISNTAKAAGDTSAPNARGAASRAKRPTGSESEKDVSKLSAVELRRLERRNLKKRHKNKSEWDSPLILAGGGALALLVLCGVLVTWMLNSESGDEMLRSARDARDAGSYTQSISQYEKYLEQYQRHSEWSLARVELAMVRVRQATESGNFPLALDVAQGELKEIEKEPEFDKAHAEMAALLPQIARGLADRAEAATDPETAAKSVEAANAALTLCSNTKYVPKSLRDETELDDVQKTLDRVALRQKSRQDLQQSLQSIETAVKASDTRSAYEIYKHLVDAHPELSGDSQLAAMLARISAAEQAGIRFVAEEQAPQTTERPVPWSASLTVAYRHPQSTAAGSNGTACVRVDGAVYALDAASGKVLWRRFVGFAPAAPPLTVGSDVLVVDAAFQELLRLDARTGNLRWRQEIGEQMTDPVVVGERIYVAAESGRLYVIDAVSGKRLGYLQFAQTLRVPPAVDRSGKRLYLTGDHSSIYSVSLTDLSCLGVYYLGHSTGSVRVAPAPLLDKIAVLVNDGAESCRLHLLSLDKTGAVAGSVTVRRLNGLAIAPPLAEGRRLVVTTDRGQIEVFDVGEGQEASALTAVATRPATSQQPLVRHVALANGHFWVGDTKLTKYGVVPTGDRLPVESIEEDFSGATFDYPLELFGTTLVHVRRPADRAGFAVAATDTEQGNKLWETDLAVPPAWSPIVEAQERAFAVANANGFVFHIGPVELRSRVQDEAIQAATSPSRLPTLTAGVDLGGGRAAFTAAASHQLLLYDPAQQREPLHWVDLPSPLACNVSAFGKGLLAPLKIGQVFYLAADSGRPLATPYQPRLQPRMTVPYQPAAEVGSEGRQFVITDGREKLFLIAEVDQPQPHLAAVTEASVGPFPIVSPIVVLGGMAAAVTDGHQLARFHLPSLEPAGETDLRGSVIAGPYLAGDQLLLITADQQLMAVSAGGEIAWKVPLELGDLAGPPLTTDKGILLAYKKGILERRAAADGRSLGQLDVRQPLAAGPVRFLDGVVLTAHDGTLLLVDQP